MPVNPTHVKAIKKTLQKFDFSNLEERCSNEAQTRLCLIEPILETLGYSRIDDMATEINAGWGRKNNKADIGLVLKRGKEPEIIIECKKHGKRLTDKEGSQLNDYFINTNNSKLGILTNGLVWKFYCPNKATKQTKLFDVPFLELNFSELNSDLYEKLSLFHKGNIDLKEVVEDAQEVYFLEGFEDAFASELADPSEKLIQAIFNRMEGKRMSDPLKEKIRNLINSKTIQEALPKVIEEEARNGSIVITTAEELKIYHSVKTILLNTVKKIDSTRINYRDQKSSFNVLVDDNQKQIIAKITTSRNKYYLEIGGNKNDKHEVSDIESIVSLKKKLKEVTQPYFQ